MKDLGEGESEVEKRIEASLASIEEWRGRTIRYTPAAPSVVSPIHRAVENACYQVSLDDSDHFFVKALYDDMVDFVDFSQTAAICAQMGDLGITPALHAVNTENRVMAFDFLSSDWSWGKVDDLADPQILENVITAKKKIQDSKPFDREHSVFDLVRSYWSRVGTVAAFVPGDVSDIVGQIFEIEKIIQAGGVDIKPCHADGTASNIMVGPGGAVQLVDFDWSRNCDPHYDMATIMLEGFQAESDMWRVVEIFDGSLDERTYNRCRLYGIADDLMWALWGFLCFKTSPRVEVEFTKYAEWRLLRCRMNLRDPSYEKWRRRV
jgi:thiamine kinase-like enzyme